VHRYYYLFIILLFTALVKTTARERNYNNKKKADQTIHPAGLTVTKLSYNRTELRRKMQRIYAETEISRSALIV